MRRIRGAAGWAAAVLALGLAGCSSPAAQGTAASPGDSLTVYSPQGEGVRGEYIAEQASQQLGIEIEFVSGGGGELTTRLLNEQNNAQADVVLGLGESQLYQLDRAGMLGDFTPEWSGAVPAEFQVDSSGFTLFSQTPVVMAYNSAALSPDEAPTSWEDLASDSYAGRFALPGMTSQTGQAFVVGVLWRYADPATGEVSDQGWSVLQSILDNAAPLGEGAELDWTQVESGEIPIVVNWLGGVQTGAADSGLDMTIVAPPGGSPYVSTGVGIIDGTDALDGAQRFVDWFGSAKFQADFVSATNNDTPVSTEALALLPDASAKLESIEKQSIDWKVVERLLPEWQQRIELDVL